MTTPTIPGLEIVQRDGLLLVTIQEPEKAPETHDNGELVFVIPILTPTATIEADE